MRTSSPGPEDPEVRTRAIAVVRPRGVPRAPVARALGSTGDTLRLGVRQAELDAGRRDGLATAERAEVTRLRRQNAVLQAERERRKPAARLLASARVPR